MLLASYSNELWKDMSKQATADKFSMFFAQYYKLILIFSLMTRSLSRILSRRPAEFGLQADYMNFGTKNKE